MLHTACNSFRSTDRPRLRLLHPILDEDGSCSLLYDLERTFVIQVPPRFRRSLEPALRSGAYPAAMKSWLICEGLLTQEPRRSWAQGAQPALPAVTDVSLDLAGACNLGCLYCFEKDIPSRIGPMSATTAAEALDFVFNKASASRRIVFHFGSGEPLLRFDLLRTIIAEAERRAARSGREVSFELTTNATLVTADVARFLSEHPFHVRVSCDGPPRLQDAFRPYPAGQGSYPAVERGLGLLLAAIPDRVTVNSVLAGGTRLAELWNWAKQIGVRHYHVIKVGAFGQTAWNLREAEVRSFREDLQAICGEVFRELEAGRRPLDYQPITKIVRRLMIPQPITRFCGVAGSYLGVAPNGKVYPCFRHEGLPKYELGDVRKGVEDHRRRSFLGSVAADVDSRPVCKECWARYLCGGGCYADATVYGADPCKPPEHHCPFWRVEIELAIRLYRRMVDADPAYCLLLFGDSPNALACSAAGKPKFVQRRNCQ